MNSFDGIKETILSGGIEEGAYKQIRDKIQKSNRTTVLIFSTVAVIAFTALLIVSIFVKTLAPYRAIYAPGLAVSVIVWILAKYEGDKHPAAMTADVYLFAFMLLSVGIVIGTVMSTNEISAVYIALLLAVPQVFTDRPWRMYLLIIVSVVMFIVMTILFKNPATRSSDITNAVLFGIISIALCTYTNRNTIKKFYYEYQIRFLAENDQLTGLKNRYSYQQRLDNTDMLRTDSIYCIYVDVNGLHELNNTRGHEAGDKMLQYVASVMQNLFGKENTYRIGGDEFVALGVGKSREETEELVAKMKSAVETAGYHIAAGIGIRQKKEIEVNSIIKDAEKEMYKDKAEFYRQSGNDRRRK